MIEQFYSSTDAFDAALITVIVLGLVIYGLIKLWIRIRIYRDTPSESPHSLIYAAYHGHRPYLRRPFWVVRIRYYVRWIRCWSLNCLIFCTGNTLPLVRVPQIVRVEYDLKCRARKRLAREPSPPSRAVWREAQALVRQQELILRELTHPTVWMKSVGGRRDELEDELREIRRDLRSLHFESLIDRSYFLLEREGGVSE